MFQHLAINQKKRYKRGGRGSTKNISGKGQFVASDFVDLKNGKQYYLNQNLSIDQKIATMSYLSDQPEPGELYSMSQLMNHKLSTDQTLSANEKYTYDTLMTAMHDLGSDIKLTRYTHDTFIDDVLKSKGMTKGYESYTEDQLKKALVGTEFTHKSFLSTSYNDFKNAPTSNPFTNRAVKQTILAKSTTKGYMPGNGPGGKLGEIVLAPSSVGSNNSKIIDVRFTGAKARAKGSTQTTKRQIELVIGIE